MPWLWRNYMKLFANLSDEHKERAIHTAEHMVINSLLTDGFEIEPEAPEDKEAVLNIKEVIEHAKTLEDPSKQTEYLFENQLTGDLIFEKAYQLAIAAFYIEKNELAFNLEEMDEHFDNSDDDGNEEKETEKQEIINKKIDVSKLN